MHNKIFKRKLEGEAGQEEREVCIRHGKDWWLYESIYREKEKGDRKKEPRKSSRKLEKFFIASHDRTKIECNLLGCYLFALGSE